jgi:hypothetical protein
MSDFGYMTFCTSDTLRDHIPFATFRASVPFRTRSLRNPFHFVCVRIRILIAVTIVRLMFFIYAACSVD